MSTQPFEITDDDVFDPSPADPEACSRLLLRMRQQRDARDGLPDAEDWDDLSDEQRAALLFTMVLYLRVLRFLLGVGVGVVFLALMQAVTGDTTRPSFNGLSAGEQAAILDLLGDFQARLLREGSI